MADQTIVAAGTISTKTIKGNSEAPALEGNAITHDDSADYTLSAAEYSNFGHRVGGTLTAGRNLVVPNEDYYTFWVDNQTAGGFALTVKTSGGTGVSLTNAKSRWFYVLSDEVYPIGAES